MKTIRLLAAAFLLLSCTISNGQCISLPTFPATLGTEPLLVNNDEILSSQTKWFYGTGIIDGANLRGGTIIVSGSLTLNNFNFESGRLVIQSSGSVLITNGAGLVLRGNCYIYNWGYFQIHGNIVLDNGVTSASQPNLVVNATASSNFQMPNQYFVINNPWSRLINNGFAAFGGVITDYTSAAGSVCFGDGSITDMQVLYNYVKHPYIISSGSACLRVTTYTQFRDTLTNYPNLLVCLGSGHSSCTSTGCRPNAWGAAIVGTNCNSCIALRTTLTENSFEANADAKNGFTSVTWQYKGATRPEKFVVQRSKDGINFFNIDTLYPYSMHFEYKDYTRQYATIYYRIIAYYESGVYITSNTVAVKHQHKTGLYPNPFSKYFQIPLTDSDAPVSVTIYDANGILMKNYTITKTEQSIIINAPGLPPGLYHILTQRNGESFYYKAIKQ
jgi:hypothetical protein